MVDWKMSIHSRSRINPAILSPTLDVWLELEATRVTYVSGKRCHGWISGNVDALVYKRPLITSVYIT